MKELRIQNWEDKSDHKIKLKSEQKKSEQKDDLISKLESFEIDTNKKN